MTIPLSTTINTKFYLSIVIMTAVFIAPLVAAQLVTITESPSPFSAVAPENWSRQPPATGNSRLKFVSPKGTPYAECDVIVKTLPIPHGISQAEVNTTMLEMPDPEVITNGLSLHFENVRVISAGNEILSGIPAQTYNVQYSVGTSPGIQWVRSVSTTTMTVPDISWTVTCGGQGHTLEEAQKAFDYWQLEFAKFLTFITFLR